MGGPDSAEALLPAQPLSLHPWGMSAPPPEALLRNSGGSSVCARAWSPRSPSPPAAPCPRRRRVRALGLLSLAPSRLQPFCDLPRGPFPPPPPLPWPHFRCSCSAPSSQKPPRTVHQPSQMPPLLAELPVSLSQGPRINPHCCSLVCGGAQQSVSSLGDPKAAAPPPPAP